MRMTASSCSQPVLRNIEVLNELPVQNDLPVEGNLSTCSLCTCGQHTCPPKHSFGSADFPPETKSEYIQKYPPWPLATRKAHKLPPPPINQAPFSGETTYHQDFDKKKIPQRRRYLPSLKTLENCIPAGSLTNAASEYAARFKKFPVQPRHPQQKPPAEAATAPFDGRTTHSCDYKEWPLAIRAPIKQAESSKSDGVFDDITTYKVAFWDKSKNLKAPKRVEKLERVETGQFYGSTTNAADYGPKPLAKKSLPPKQHASAAACVNHQGAPFDGETTYHEKFRPWKIRIPVRGARTKEATPISAADRFDADSTYHSDFTAPRLPKRCPVRLRPRPEYNHRCPHRCHCQRQPAAAAS